MSLQPASAPLSDPLPARVRRHHVGVDLVALPPISALLVRLGRGRVAHLLSSPGPA